MQLSTHENDECEERPIVCCFNKIGCLWRGPFHERGIKKRFKIIFKNFKILSYPFKIK